MPTYINNLCSAPYSLTGSSGYKPLLTLEDIAAAIQELTDLQNQLSCCSQTEKDAEAIVFTATPSGTAPNYDWSCEIRLNTCFFAGDVLTVDLTGIPNNFTLDSISPITPATVLINVAANTLVFTGTVLAGTYFVISGTFDDNVCAAGTATLTLSGDTIITNNVVTGAYSGATWCVPPVPPTTGLQNVNNATMGAPNNSDSGCAGGFISETVTITGGGLNIPITTFPANLCALLDNLAVTSGTTELTITSTVVTACGTASDTLILPIVEVGGLITTIDGVDCSPKFSLLKAGSTVLFDNSKTYLNVSGINGLLDDAPYQDLSLMATYSLYDVSNVLLASGTMLANNTDVEILASTLPTKKYYYYRIDITDSFGNMHKLNSWFYVDLVGNITDSLYQVTSLAYDNTTTTLSVGVGGTSWANLPVNDGSVDYLNDSSPELTGAGVASSWAINAALTTTWNALKVVRKNTLYPTRESYSISWLKFS